jgi:hypothetical protein
LVLKPGDEDAWCLQEFGVAVYIDLSQVSRKMCASLPRKSGQMKHSIHNE